MKYPRFLIRKKIDLAGHPEGGRPHPRADAGADGCLVAGPHSAPTLACRPHGLRTRTGRAAGGSPQARELFDEGAHLFIDTRPGNPLERPTIAGAFIIREASFDDDLLALFDILFPEDPLIVFGRGDMQGANNIASKLQARGFTDVQILRGGVKSWEQAGGQLGSAYIPDGFPLDDGSLPSGDGGGS
jgi:rhodanese-related sulfurtransferase